MSGPACTPVSYCFHLLAVVVIDAEVNEDPPHLRPPLFRRRERIQNLVVLLRCLSDPLLGQRVRERRSSMHHGALLMALPDGGVFPGVHPLPSDMLPANPTVARLRSGV